MDCLEKFIYGPVKTRLSFESRWMKYEITCQLMEVFHTKVQHNMRKSLWDTCKVHLKKPYVN